MKKLMENWRQFINEEDPDKSPEYFILFDDKITMDVIKEVALEILGLAEEPKPATIDGKEGAKIKATKKGLERLKKAFEKNGLQTANIMDAGAKQPI